MVSVRSPLNAPAYVPFSSYVLRPLNDLTLSLLSSLPSFYCRYKTKRRLKKLVWRKKNIFLSCKLIMGPTAHFKYLIQRTLKHIYTFNILTLTRCTRLGLIIYIYSLISIQHMTNYCLQAHSCTANNRHNTSPAMSHSFHAH